MLQAYIFLLSLIGFCVGTCYCLGRSFITICLWMFYTGGRKEKYVSSCDVVFLGVCLGTSWSGHLSFVAASRLLHDINVVLLQG
jgi:hypothetical protein